MTAAAEQETRGSGAEIRARIGHQIWDSSTSPQVTGLVPNRAKIVRVFEFMSLTSAPAGFEPALTAPERVAVHAPDQRKRVPHTMIGGVSGEPPG
jgi:hypothetical protein